MPCSFAPPSPLPPPPCSPPVRRPDVDVQALRPDHAARQPCRCRPATRSRWKPWASATITYECRAKANMPGQYEWVFVGPDAKLMGPQRQAGRQVLRPARHLGEHGRLQADRHASCAVSPDGDGNIPLQLVKANPAMGSGAMTGVTYIQRVATKGGVAPAMACAPANMGAKQIVKYQADYIFYKAM